MVKRGPDGRILIQEHHVEGPSSVFVMAPDGIVQGMTGQEPNTPPSEKDEPMPASEPPADQEMKQPQSQPSTATSTPVVGPAPTPGKWDLSAHLGHVSSSPEARAKAHDSHFGNLPVKELKARLVALGADISALVEKEELIELLEELVEERKHNAEPFVL